MLDAAKAVRQHVAHKSFADFEEDRLLLGGVIRELLIIGEAANAVSPTTKAAIAAIPWKQVVGMRNQLIHGYFDVSHQIIWNTINEDILKLIDQLEKALLI